MKQTLSTSTDLGSDALGYEVAVTLETLFESFQPLIPYDRIGYASIHEGITRSAWARSDLEVPIRLKVGYEAPLASSSLAAVAATGEPRVLNDLTAYLVEHPDSQSTRLVVAEGIRSSLTCPIQVRGVAVGFLFFSSAAPNTYATMNPRALLGLAKMLSAVVSQDLDVHAQDLVAENLRQQAQVDPLTGLLNRRGLEMALRSSQSPGSPQASLIMVDIDNFKSVNDAQGHAAGDQLLHDVAKILTAIVRRADHVARIGGDEFVVFLADAHGAERVTSLIVATIAALDAPVTASVGCIDFNPAHSDVATILKAADSAMYQAKANGGDEAVTRH